MKKLTLHLDSLTVESFATGADDEANGTVLGHDDDTIETEFCTMPKGCSAYPCDTRSETCSLC
jgi:hypothetical protein